MIKRKLVILAIGTIVAILLSSCGTEAPAPWDWWTQADSNAVNSTLTSWRDSLNGYNFLTGQNNTTLVYPLDQNVPIVGSDTMSLTGADLVKIAHLTEFEFSPIDVNHYNDLLFGRKNDTIECKDTFCFVTYLDSTINCLGVLRYDSLWTVKFYPDTEIIVSPPETIITFKVDTIYKTGYSTIQEEENHYAFTNMRKLELKKQNGTAIYDLKYMTGFGTYIPTSTEAPTISYVILSKPGKVDTFRYSPRIDGKGIYNLKDKDSLYTLAPNESVNVYVITSTPTDTLSNRNYFFVGLGNPFVTAKSHITAQARRGEARIAFSSVGVAHLYVEVIPASAIYYPYSNQWQAAIWAIPIRVKE
jgi:hypothetical protein